jgi:hypothetical protein
MLVQTCNLSTLEDHKFEASLGYLESFRASLCYETALKKQVKGILPNLFYEASITI